MQKVPPNASLIQVLRGWEDDKVERTTERLKRTGEIFTPTVLVNDVLDKLPMTEFIDPNKTFFDGSCGNGQFLAAVLLRKLQNGHNFEQALRTIFGIDIMFDNVDLCRNRLLCGVEQFRFIVENNIICADFLSFDISTWEPAPAVDPKLLE